jgi:hypothetical protein
LSDPAHGVVIVAPPGADWPARIGAHLGVWYSICVARLGSLDAMWPILGMGGVGAVFIDATLATASWRAEWRARSSAGAVRTVFVVGGRADTRGIGSPMRDVVHLPWPMTTVALDQTLRSTLAAGGGR